MRNPGQFADEFKKRTFIAFNVLMGVLAVSTLGFYFISGQKASIIDCLYMTVITITTVGYGEIVDLSGNPGGRVFAMFVILSGMGVILYFISNITAFIIDGDLREIFWRKRMQKILESIKDHYIVCGAGSMGQHIVDELHRTGRQVVVIDMRDERIEALKGKFPDTALIQGDASENDVLLEAGIARAAGIVVATDNDKDNLVVTITARQMCPGIRIVTRCTDIKHTGKIKGAGADSVVTSNYIGGLRMASEMVRPTVVSFLDNMLRDRDKDLRIEEFSVAAGGRFDGSPASAAKALVLVLAVHKPDGCYVFNPPDNYTLNAGETIVFMGCPKDFERLKG